MNKPYCNKCDTLLLEEGNRPKQQIVIKDLMVYHPQKGAGQLNEAHFCGVQCLSEWITEQFDRPVQPIVLTDDDTKKRKGKNIVQLNGRV